MATKKKPNDGGTDEAVVLSDAEFAAAYFEEHDNVPTDSIILAVGSDGSRVVFYDDLKGNNTASNYQKEAGGQGRQVELKKFDKPQA